MTENELIHFTTGEKCWFGIGVGCGMLLLMVVLVLYTYLPTITPFQQAGLSGFVSGGGVVWLLQKIKW